jgi:lipoprotein-anchoring transpeptidase ErfK/SrfK
MLQLRLAYGVLGRVRMKSGETLLVIRALIVRGGPAMALLGLVVCATTATTPVSRQADPAFARKVVTYPTPVPPGTIVIDPGSHFLYLVQGGGQAIRYGVGVGGEGFGWSGSGTVHSKQEWPDWYPPTEMLQRKPELREHMTQPEPGFILILTDVLTRFHSALLLLLRRPDAT